jgi:hypothetical protein
MSDAEGYDLVALRSRVAGKILASRRIGMVAAARSA